jgi:hypothetical protein
MPNQLYGLARQFCEDVLAKVGVGVSSVQESRA